MVMWLRAACVLLFCAFGCSAHSEDHAGHNEPSHGVDAEHPISGEDGSGLTSRAHGSGGDHHEEEHGVHGHGEHGHGEHGHGHHESSAMLMTTSYLLIGFLVANFAMLKLVTWPDAHIRSFTWKMMSGTVSIYLAVLVNQTIQIVVVYAFTGLERFPDRFSLQELALTTGLFCLIFALGGVLCFFARADEDALYSVGVIGGHISAFAGIGIVRAVLKLGLSPVRCILTSGCIIGALGGVRVISALVRRRLFLSQNTPSHAHKDSESEEWRMQAIEAEDDATSIIASFALMQVVLSVVFPHASTDEHSHTVHTFTDISYLGMIEALFIAALFGTTYWRKLVEGRNQGHGFHFSAKARGMNSVQITVAMTMSWLALHLSHWLTLACFSVEHELAEIVSAAALTVFAIFTIFIVDMAADKAGEHADIQDAVTPQVPHALTGDVLNADASEAVALVAQEALDLDNLEKALRKLIDAISLAVGLSWEHAFHAALHTVVMSNDFMNHHEVMSNFAMAGGSLLLMLPIWLSIIAKNANKSVTEFQDHIDLSKTAHEKRQQKRLSVRPVHP